MARSVMEDMKMMDDNDNMIQDNDEENSREIFMEGMGQDYTVSDLLCCFGQHDGDHDVFEREIREGEYEAARERTIQKNNEMLQSLGLISTVEELSHTANNQSPKQRPANRSARTLPDVLTRDRLERQAKSKLVHRIYGEEMFRMPPPDQPYSKDPAVLEHCVDVLDPAFEEPEQQPMIGCSSSSSDHAPVSVPRPAPDEDRDEVLRAGLGSAFVTPQHSGFCSLAMTPAGSVFNSPEKPKTKAILCTMQSKSPPKFVLRMSGLANMGSKSPEQRSRESLAFAACLPNSMSQHDVVKVRENLMQAEFDIDRKRTWTAEESRKRLSRRESQIDGRKVPIDMKRTMIPDRCTGHCNCVKSGCTNNNCECVKQGRPCNELCKCCGGEWCCDMFGNKRHCKNRYGVMLSQNSREYSEMLQNKYFPNSKRTLDMSNFDGNSNSAFSFLADFALRASMPPAIVSGSKIAAEETVSSSKEPAMGSTISFRKHHDISKSCFKKITAFRDSIKNCKEEGEIDAKCEAFCTPLKEMIDSMDKIWSDLPNIAPNEMNGLDEHVQEFYRNAAQILSHTSAMDDAIVLVDKSLAMAKTQVRTREKSICYKLKGIICTKQKEYQQAIRFFRACLKNKKRMKKQHTTDYKRVKKQIKAIQLAFLS